MNRKKEAKLKQQSQSKASTTTPKAELPSEDEPKGNRRASKIQSIKTEKTKQEIQLANEAILDKLKKEKKAFEPPRAFLED